jgi:transcriptional regulator with XRE-family HTH domain
MGTHKAQPYISFGKALRQLRERARKSPMEVSGAVEIDTATLMRYETGEIRPSEDILILLIQHFSLKEDEASELWRLAGYLQSPSDAFFFANDEFAQRSKTTSDNSSDRIVYTDMIQVMVNNYGVIMQFMQGAGMSSQPLAVARVGMSKEHARSVMEVLKKTLEQADAMVAKKPLQLPPSNQSQD